MTNKQNLVSLVGLGYWGKNLCRNLYELNALQYACDNDLEKLRDLKEKYPDVAFTDSFKEIVDNKEVSAVAIASPAATHYDLVKKCLETDKDVFVEKPLALNLKDGEELVKLAQRKNKILMVGHILRYHPAVSKLKKMIQDGALGKTRYIYSNRLNIGKLRTEENILWSFAPHDISVILHLMDEEPETVYAFGADYVNKGVSDVTMTTLGFARGVKGHVFVSWLHPYKEQKLIVVGSQAMVVFDDVSKEKLFLYPHTIQWKEGKIPVAQKADFEVISVESAEPLKKQMEHFIECIKTRKTPDTDGNEGLRVLSVLERAEKSIAEKKQ